MDRRQFTKTLGSTVALSALSPRLLWALETPASVVVSASKQATDLYRKAFVLDCNALAGIGFPISDDDPAGVTKLIDSFVPPHLTCGLRRSPSIRRLPAGRIVGSDDNPIGMASGLNRWSMIGLAL